MSSPAPSGRVRRDVIVIGGSAGALGPIRRLVADLPTDLQAAIFIVLHMRPEGPSHLHGVIERAGLLPARQAVDGDIVRTGVITVAAPDRHLILDDGIVRSIHGPRENRYRPSVDVLFRSAALSYGNRVIAIVLSGSLSDGASGLVAVKKYGGVAIVQDPADAMFPSMPINALQSVPVDHMVTADGMGALIVRLASEAINARPTPVSDPMRSAEVRMVKGEKAEITDVGRPSIFTCPECTGVLWEVDEPEVLRFRCRVGHAYSAESLMSGQEETQEAALWAGIRALEENAKLSERLAQRFRERQQDALADRMADKARISMSHADEMRNMVVTMPDAGVSEAGEAE